MSKPTLVRSTAGFRNATLFELTSGLPLGALVLEPVTPFQASGSVIQSSGSVVVARGTAVAGPVPYYGATISGVKVLTLNDPTPRVLPHVGDDGVMSLQVLPATEPVTGELTVDKTNDIVDLVVSAVKSVTVGEMNIMGQATNKRGFEPQVGVLAYSAGQDTDPNSSTFGNQEWDFRILPKALVFTRDTGYRAEVNERMYTVAPQYSTSHIWGTQFTVAADGFKRAQIIRGNSEYRPVMCGFLGDAATLAFPFSVDLPAYSTAKIVVWKNGVLLSTGVTKSLYGLVFAVAPLATDIITVLYETNA
jgi:hypothetical protein